MDFKDFLDDWFDHYDQVQIDTTQGGRCVQKQKGGNGTKQLQIAHLKTDAGEEIHVNVNTVKKESLWLKLCGGFFGVKPIGNYRRKPND